MKKTLTASILFLLGFISSFAADMQKMGTFLIPFLVDGPNKGIYVKAFNAIQEKVGSQYGLLITPVQRTVANFKDKAIVGFFPATTKSMPSDGIATESFTEKKVLAFTLTEKGTIKEIKELRNKTVGIVNGFSYGPDVAKMIENQGKAEGFKSVVSQDSDSLNVNLLLKGQGRIDCFLAEENSGIAAVKASSDASKISYDRKASIVSIPLFFAFQGTEQEKAKKFSEVIKQMKADGSLQKILSE